MECSMKFFLKLFVLFSISSLVVIAQNTPKPIDLSKLELLNRIIVPGHAQDTLGQQDERSDSSNVRISANPIEIARFGPNGKGLAILDFEGRLIWWDVRTGEQLESWKLWQLTYDPKITYSLQDFIERKTVRLLENHKRYKLFDLETGKMQTRQSRRPGKIRHADNIAPPDRGASLLHLACGDGEHLSVIGGIRHDIGWQKRRHGLGDYNRLAGLAKGPIELALQRIGMHRTGERTPGKRERCAQGQASAQDITSVHWPLHNTTR